MPKASSIDLEVAREALTVLGVSPATVAGLVASVAQLQLDVDAAEAAIAALTGGAAAFVTFNGTGTPAILSQRNVASITDHGVGDYTINFTTPIAHANYVLAGGCRDAIGTASELHENQDVPVRTVNALRIYTLRIDGVPRDCPFVGVAIFV